MSSPPSALHPGKQASTCSAIRRLVGHALAIVCTSASATMGQTSTGHVGVVPRNSPLDAQPSVESLVECGLRPLREPTAHPLRRGSRVLPVRPRTDGALRARACLGFNVVVHVVGLLACSELPKCLLA